LSSDVNCDSFVAYHVEKGQIQSLDVSGLTIVKITYVPGNALAGNWRKEIENHPISRRNLRIKKIILADKDTRENSHEINILEF
jgi:hypothetical protein